MLLESFTGTSGRRKNKFWNYFALESDNRVYSTSKTDSLMRRHDSRWQSFISYLRINIPSRCSYPEILLLWLANWDSCSCCSNAQLHSFHIVNRLLYNVQCVCVCVFVDLIDFSVQTTVAPEHCKHASNANQFPMFHRADITQHKYKLIFGSQSIGPWRCCSGCHYLGPAELLWGSVELALTMIYCLTHRTTLQDSFY